MNTYGYVGGNPTKFTDRLGLFPPNAAPIGCWYSWKRTWWEKTTIQVMKAVEQLQTLSRGNCAPIPMPSPTATPQPDLPDPRNPNKPPIGINPLGQITFDPNYSYWWCIDTVRGTVDVFDIEKEIGTFDLYCERCGNITITPGGKAETGETREQFIERRGGDHTVGRVVKRPL